MACKGANQLARCAVIGGADVAEALGRQVRLMTSTVPGAWTLERPTALASFTGVAVAGFNAVTPRGRPADPAEMAELLDAVAAAGLPHCLQTRVADAPAVAPIAQARSMRYLDGLPFYVLAGPARGADGRAVRELAPEEAGVHAELAGAGFGLGRRLFATLISPATLCADGVRAYVVEDRKGTALATGLGVTIGPATGIVNVTTRAQARGRGLATAITARIVADGRAAGAQWSFLASTVEGAGVYERLGFAAVERWACWESPLR